MSPVVQAQGFTPPGGDSDQINFLNGVARRRHHSWVRSFPWTRFFDGVRGLQKAVGHCQTHGAQFRSARVSFQRGGTARAMAVPKKHSALALPAG